MAYRNRVKEVLGHQISYGTRRALGYKYLPTQRWHYSIDYRRSFNIYSHWKYFVIRHQVVIKVIDEKKSITKASSQLRNMSISPEAVQPRESIGDLSKIPIISKWRAWAPNSREILTLRVLLVRPTDTQKFLCIVTAWPGSIGYAAGSHYVSLRLECYFT